MPQLTDEEFRLISTLVYTKFGINLSEQKRSLIIERLQKVMRQGQFDSFKAYVEYVVADTSGRAMLEMVDRISTNHTSFFRENDHFSFLQSTILPGIVAAEKKTGRRSLRIWSAGCSSGEEPYTIGMLLLEYFGAEVGTWDIGILATDISTTVLEKAGAGIYSESQMEQVPVVFRKKYFRKADEPGQWQISPEVKKLVLFRRLNLMNKDYPFKGQFQVIFCRNVMIYFDAETRDGLLSRFQRYNEPGGYLMIGHSETLNRDNQYYQYIRPAIYQKK